MLKYIDQNDNLKNHPKYVETAALILVSGVSTCVCISAWMCKSMAFIKYYFINKFYIFLAVEITWYFSFTLSH